MAGLGRSTRGAALFEWLVGMTLISAVAMGGQKLASASNERFSQLGRQHDALWQDAEAGFQRDVAEHSLIVAQGARSASETHAYVAQQLPISGWAWRGLQPWVAGLQWTGLPELKRFKSSGLGLPLQEPTQ